jgi:hypothetical protein
MAQTQKEKDYIENLKKLVIQIQGGISDDETLNQLNDAKNWNCYGYSDRLLLNELIKNAEEYLNLELKFKLPHNYSEEEKERRSFLVGWFTQIYSDLKQYEIMLPVIINFVPSLIVLKIGYLSNSISKITQG